MPGYSLAPVPYAGRSGDSTIAEMMIRSGQQAAQAQREAGQRQGQMIAGIGSAISGGIQDWQQNRMAQAKLAQEQEDRRLRLQPILQQQADQKSLDNAMSTPGLDPDAIEASLPGHLRANFRKSWNDSETAKVELQKARLATKELEADYKGSLAAGLEPHLKDPDGGLGAAQMVFAKAKADGVVSPDELEQLTAAVQQNPAILGPMVQSLRNQSPKQQRFMAEQADRERQGKVADAQIANMTADNQRQGLMLNETVRHNRASEAAATVRAAGGESTLSGPALDNAANALATTGQLPPGMGRDRATMRAVQNRAAELFPNGIDYASNAAAFKANQASLGKLQTNRDQIHAFENTALKNIDLFLNTAGKIVDTGSPMANTLARQVSGKMLGSPDQAAYDAARRVALNEIAKITGGGGLSGVVSDSARHEIESFNPDNATLAQTVAVLRTLKQDMANRAGSLDDEIAGIKGRLRGGPADSGGRPGAGGEAPKKLSDAELAAKYF